MGGNESMPYNHNNVKLNLKKNIPQYKHDFNNNQIVQIVFYILTPMIMVLSVFRYCVWFNRVDKEWKLILFLMVMNLLELNAGIDEALKIRDDIFNSQVCYRTKFWRDVWFNLSVLGTAWYVRQTQVGLSQSQNDIRGYYIKILLISAFIA